MLLELLSDHVTYEMGYLNLISEIQYNAKLSGNQSESCNMIHSWYTRKYFPEIVNWTPFPQTVDFEKNLDKNSKHWQKILIVQKNYRLFPGFSRFCFTKPTYRQSTTVPSVSESKIQLHPCGHISADTMTCGQNDKFADSHNKERTPLYDPIFLFFIIITWALKL